MNDEIKTEEPSGKEETVSEEKADAAEAPAGTTGEAEGEEKPLEKMTAPELREIAKEIPGVTGVHAMKKDELLEVVKAYRGIKDEKPAKKKTRKKSLPALSAKELKEKIAKLKEAKEAARQANDKRKVDVYRRRINRTKKLTRKVAQK
jgi:hypothetical protein